MSMKVMIYLGRGPFMGQVLMGEINESTTASFFFWEGGGGKGRKEEGDKRTY